MHNSILFHLINIIKNIHILVFSNIKLLKITVSAPLPNKTIPYLNYLCRPRLICFYNQTIAIKNQLKYSIRMYRTHTCGELRMAQTGQQVTLAGWVQTIRKFGSITFIDLRDRYGITQLLLGEELNNQLDQQPLGREFVLQATGTVAERSNKNPNLPTGDVEIKIASFTILNKSATPPFTIQDDTDGGDDLRMKFRYLDLRRNAVKKNLELRYAVNRAARNYLHENGFMDIETP